MNMDLMSGLKIAAVGASGMFAGMAAYISCVEHPSRLGLPVNALLQQWSNSFNIASKLMPFLGVVSSATATGVYFKTDPDDNMRPMWLVPAVTFALGTGFTILRLLPDVAILQQDGIVEKKGEDFVRQGINTWNRRHCFCLFLDTFAFISVVIAAVNGKNSV